VASCLRSVARPGRARSRTSPGEARDEAACQEKPNTSARAASTATGREHLRAAQPEHRPAQHPQAARLQLSPTRKSSSHADSANCSVAHLADHPEAEGADQHAGAKIAEHGAELEALKQRHEQHRGEEKTAACSSRCMANIPEEGDSPHYARAARRANRTGGAR